MQWKKKRETCMPNRPGLRDWSAIKKPRSLWFLFLFFLFHFKKNYNKWQVVYCGGRPVTWFTGFQSHVKNILISQNLYWLISKAV